LGIGQHRGDIAALAARLARVDSKQRGGTTMKDTAIKVAGLLLGVLIAVAGAAAAFGMLVLVFHFFPTFEHRALPWPAWLLALVLETLLVVGTVRLWARRRPMAIGILLAAGIFGTHFVMHIASHWNG
jgi:hypothetical protein